MNSSNQRDVRIIVSMNECGMRLDYWLAKRFTYHSRSVWQGLIGNGGISINGHRSKSAYKLAVGDVVEYHVSDATEPAVDLTYRVVLEDDALLIVNKSGNLPCHPAGKFFRNTLWYLLRDRLEEFHILHRLDRETSGLVVIAKDKKVSKNLSRQFEKGDICKEYLVLVEGHFPDEYEADGFLIPDRDSDVRKKRAFTKYRECVDGEAAITRFIKVEENQGLSLLRVIPGTGRTHQIRATLCSLGFPVVGDKLYGVDDQIYLRYIDGKMTNDDRFRLRMGRQALHALSLSLIHPVDNRRLTVTAEIPADFFPVNYLSGENVDKFIARATCATV